MIVSEYFYCSVYCEHNTCDCIVNSDVFCVIDEFSLINGVLSKKNENGYYLFFNSKHGTFTEFVKDIYLHKEEILPIMDDDTITVIYKYDGQCNLSFEPDLLEIISKMNLRLNVTCYASDE